LIGNRRTPSYSSGLLSGKGNPILNIGHRGRVGGGSRGVEHGTISLEREAGC